MVPNEVLLFKLVWHPDNFWRPGDVGDFEVKPSAFRKQDLSGAIDCFVSVDRSDLSQRATMEMLAKSQAAKANGRDILREQALIGRLSCEAVRSVEIDNIRVFGVISDPLPENPAHCGIKNAVSQSKPDPAFLLELQTKLALIASPAVTFDEAYGPAP